MKVLLRDGEFLTIPIATVPCWLSKVMFLKLF